MMSDDFRAGILELLSEGKITTTEAIEMLDRGPDAAAGHKTPSSAFSAFPEEAQSASELKGKSPASQSADDEAITITEDDLALTKPAGSGMVMDDGKRPRWLKIRVSNLETGHDRVSVTLPVGLISLGFGIAQRFGARDEDFTSVSEMWKVLKDGQQGVLIDVEDEEDNERVRIFLE